MTTPLNDIVVLRGTETELSSSEGHQFVIDCVRAAEGLLTDQALRETYEISPANWENITKSTALMHAIRDERTRRVRNGTAAREAAAQHFIKAPAILDGIMCDTGASPRHRIESVRELRQIAANDAEKPAESSERFIITINLGADEVLKFNKSIKVDANDVDPNDVDSNQSAQMKVLIPSDKVLDVDYSNVNAILIPPRTKDDVDE